MNADSIPFRQTGYFSDLVCDYMDEKELLRPFYHRFPNLENFHGQIEEKSKCFPESHRDVLYEALQEQYAGFHIGKKTQTHIRQLKEPITFTVVTGHQLNLFTGPLYFLYKIVSTINLTLELKKAYPKYNFVPVYWMATEDHDFEEINFFNFRGKKIQWNPKGPINGAVGRMSTSGLDQVYEAVSSAFEGHILGQNLKDLFRKAYLTHQDLADATRFLVNALFGEYGLVIVDGDHVALKRLLVPCAEQDIFETKGFQEVSRTISRLNALPVKYGIQVNPREINFFYIKDGLRERIVEKGGKFQVLNTDLAFSKGALLEELKGHPERFSPNVIMRPLYQEIILPNLCYIGGGGEIAYWLELKGMFRAFKIPFPILLLRNSALVITGKQSKKLQKLKIDKADLFLKQNNLINKKIREISNIDIDFSPQKKHLEEQFHALYKLAEHTDKSFLGAVEAQETKQKNGLDNLEKRLLKAQKKKLADHVARMTELHNVLFPNQSLQERVVNFSEIYSELGEDLIPMLMKSLKPLSLEFILIKVP